MSEIRHDVVYRNGKPAAVILNIEDYHELLERLEDVDDLRTLRKLRQRPLKFRKLSDFLSEYRPSNGRRKTSVRG